jgi:sulfur carrier protein
MAISLTINGQVRLFEALPTSATLDQLVQELGLKGDRVAIEYNGNLAPRTTWAQTVLAQGDRLEVVHFVGGGSAGRRP